MSSTLHFTSGVNVSPIERVSGSGRTGRVYTPRVFVGFICLSCLVFGLRFDIFLVLFFGFGFALLG